MARPKSSGSGDASAAARRLPRAWQLIGLVVVVLLFAEGAARLLGPHLPPLLTGDGYEMQLKWDRVEQLGSGPAARRPQVVVFGNSMTDAGVTPETFTASSERYDSAYNAALIGAPVTSQARWASNYVLPELHPDVVVLGVSPLDLLDVNPLDLLDVTSGEGRSQAVTDAFDATLDDLRPSALHRLQNRMDGISALVAHRSSLRSPRTTARAIGDALTGKEPREAIPQVATVEGNKVVPRDLAFWRSTLRPTGGTEQFHQRRLDVDRDTELEGRLAKAVARADYRPDRLRELLEAVSGDGRKVVVAIPPLAAETMASEPGALPRLEAGADLIARLASDAGATVVDFTADQYPLSAFADVAHLNQLGSDRFSRDLGRAVDGL